MNWLIKILTKLGLLKDDLDYHLIRASMVIIYFFFGYQKWFDYEAQGLIPFFTHGPLIFLDVPCFRHQRLRILSRCFRMAIWSVVARRVLEQEAGSVGSSRVGVYLHRNSHNHSLYAGRLGSVCRRLSRHGWKRCFSYEGCGPACRFVLSTEAGRSESGAPRETKRAGDGSAAGGLNASLKGCGSPLHCL